MKQNYIWLCIICIVYGSLYAGGESKRRRIEQSSRTVPPCVICNKQSFKHNTRICDKYLLVQALNSIRDSIREQDESAKVRLDIRIIADQK